jgi:hypothetical protein
MNVAQKQLAAMLRADSVLALQHGVAMPAGRVAIFLPQGRT